MYGWLTFFMRRAANHFGLALLGGATLLSGQSAFAGGGGETLTIEWPVEPATIATALGTAGATLLITVFAWKAGFGFARKVFGRIMRST